MVFINIKDLDLILEENDNYIQYPDKFRVIEAGAGLTRIMSHVKSGVEFLILTAFRNENYRKENVRRNIKLMEDIKNLQLGVIQLEGHYIENQGMDNEVHVKEISYFIKNQRWGEGRMELEDFKKFGKDMMLKYNQDSIVYGDGKKVYVIKFDDEFSIGERAKITYNDLEEIYSKIKGHKFIFACVYAPKITNMTSALSFQRKGYSIFFLDSN